MILRIVIFIIVFILVRMLVRNVIRMVSGPRPPSPRPRMPRRDAPGEPTPDKPVRGRIIDVDFTEKRGKGFSVTGDSDLESAVLLQDLTKEYLSPSGEPFRAVNGISFHARSGQIFGLLGPNGAGKTTTLRMLSTLIPPSSGRAIVGGCDVVREPGRVRQRIGFLTGSTGLYPRLTAREVVRYFASFYGMSGPAIEDRIRELFDRLEITAYQDKRCGELSTGMRQKVSIARAIVHDPPILILDEPTTGLDVLASRHIVDFILSSRDRGRCVIFSTHIMSEAERLCDEIAIIHRGSLTAHGTIDDLRRETGEDKVEDVFLAYLRDDPPAVEAVAP